MIQAEDIRHQPLTSSEDPLVLGLGSLGSEGDRGAGDSGSWLLLDIARAAVTRTATDQWSAELGEMWCRFSRLQGSPLPRQGWKLHVSATQLSAPLVLARCVEVLVVERCDFKFARGLRQLGDLLAPGVDRGSGGKFLTAYPANDEHCRLVAAELDRVTDGLPGPIILSDRPVRPGSIVQYRYGAVGTPEVISNDGVFESRLVGPDGQSIKDERRARFAPPPWTVSPFADHESPVSAPGRSRSAGAVLLADRFVVLDAIRHSYRGGVFRAEDRLRGGRVILKQARPHVGGAMTGTDGRDVLRHEANLLDQLGPLGLAPRKVALFEHGEISSWRRRRSAASC